MPSPAAVAAALTRLTDQSAPHRPDHRQVVEQGERAFRDLDDAAAFLEREGEDRLRTVVASARRWGDDDVADRGETLLDSLARYRGTAEPKEAAEHTDQRSVPPRSHNPLREGQRTR